MSLALLSLLASAATCEFEPSPVGYALDGPVTDTVRPTTPVVSDVVVARGEPKLFSGGCDALGTLSFAVVAEDEVSDVGFLVELVSGELPEGLDVSPVPFDVHGGRLTWTWWDSAGDPFDAVLSVSAVDRSGNESLPVGVPIIDAGRSGCAVAGSPSLGAALAGWLLVSRRRARDALAGTRGRRSATKIR